jgi:hypothetical protein
VTDCNVISERYVLKPDSNGDGWAIIHIDSNGFFGAASDFGNYAYVWDYPSMPFKDFLMKIDAHHLCEKLAQGRLKFNEKLTAQTVREWILEARRGRSISAPRARDEWYESFSIKDEHTFRNWGETRGNEFDEPWEAACYSPPSQCVAFCTRVYPRFVEILKAEKEGKTDRRYQRRQRLPGLVTDLRLNRFAEKEVPNDQ